MNLGCFKLAYPSVPLLGLIPSLDEALFSFFPLALFAEGVFSWVAFARELDDFSDPMLVII